MCGGCVMKIEIFGVMGVVYIDFFSYLDFIQRGFP